MIKIKHEVEIVETSKEVIVQAHELKIGEMGVVSDFSQYSGMVVVRAYDRLVSLGSPNVTWTCSEKSKCSIPVIPIKRGTVIKITSG